MYLRQRKKVQTVLRALTYPINSVSRARKVIGEHRAVLLVLNCGDSFTKDRSSVALDHDLFAVASRLLAECQSTSLPADTSDPKKLIE